jgi:hypothetical protein
VTRIQLHLVDHHRGLDGVRLRHDQKPVYQLGDGSRIDGGSDDEHLVDIGGDRTSSATLRYSSLEQGGAWLDAHHAVQISGRLRLQAYPVADDDSGSIPLRFSSKHRPYFTAVRCDPIDGAIPLQNGAEQPGHQDGGARLMASSSAAFTS